VSILKLNCYKKNSKILKKFYLKKKKKYIHFLEIKYIRNIINSPSNLKDKYIYILIKHGFIFKKIN
jgi:hypothetical protein